MGGKFQGLKGMDDLLPGEIEKWQWLENKSRTFFEAQGYKEIRTPLLESAELFSRTLGEESDVVHKEMYAFEDRGGRHLALRPEMTASVARAVIEHHLTGQNRVLRLYYIGPMFRGERPQAGRKRQFHQVGIELVGEAGASGDAEAIALLWRFLKFAGLQTLTLKINHLGCAKDRPALLESLKKYFTANKEKLCGDCVYRLEKNVLRIFDCKNKTCQPVIQNAPWEEWCSSCRGHFENVQELLSGELQIPFQRERRLVRGLDYYTGTVFEMVSPGLGAQDAVAGGGRYDGLYQALGGDPTPATGFSVGIERLLRSLEENSKNFSSEIQSRKVYIAPLANALSVRRAAEDYALRLRSAGFLIEMTPGEISLSTHLKKANQSGARHLVILGEDEMKKNTVSWKDLEKRTQKEVQFSELLILLNA